MSTPALLVALEAKSPMQGGLDEQAVVATIAKELKARAWRSGLEPDALETIASFYVDNIDAIKDVTARHIIHALLPASVVPQSVAVMLLGIAQPRSPGIRSIIFMWMVLVFDSFDGYDVMHSLYGALFHFVAYDSLRPWVCHLLSLLTRREDVVPFRVRKLFSIYKRQVVAKEPALIALLMVYKDYTPELVPIARPYGFKPSFKAPHGPWLRAMRAVQDARPAAELAAQAYAAQAALPHGTRTQTKRALDSWARPDPMRPRGRRGRKKRKLLSAESALALDQVSSIDDLVSQLDTIKLPKQLATVFSERSLQHLVSLDPTPGALARISHWLAARLEAELGWGASPLRPMALQLLEAVRDFARFFKELPPVLEVWLGSFLPDWNGVHAADVVLDLVTYLRPLPWDALYTGFLIPLSQLFVASGVAFQVAVLNALKTMLFRWFATDWDSHAAAVATAIAAADASGSDPPPTVPVPGFIFEGLDIGANYWLSMYQLLAWVDKSAARALALANSHSALEDAVLAFFEQYATALTDLRLPFLWVPSPGIVYPCLLSPAALSTSRIAGVLAIIKAEYPRLARDRAANAARIDFDPSVAERALLINAYIVDATNVFYRGNAFLQPQQTQLFDVPDELIDALATHDASRFALSMASNLSCTGFAADYLALAASDSARPGFDVPDLASIENTNDGNRRAEYLDYLRERGLDGLHAFLYSAITTLRKSGSTASARAE
ncbi:uncharacterized protein AMSG_01134 [Thecamonas trahens ATCC 50062]|uniref:Centromere protein I n=1 Tax=Thecamonas trahens ATCC 50062 TaxID=461836 RepID=A0A0L0DIT9_THETB|nr:hypothetical protein AMSG_01134 [Thecamonas trahens ATCC 50062]KNC52304.1 hypothetical protein AMSG_01134 [Thecamonas trahens ATCC 50062]|eukprot:XP_013762302.1 hypothetical protein AMSG_01134 [Thecamonas trahens ATCC 50062]